MSAKQSPLIFQKWATFFAGRKPGDVITPDDINHAKRIVWHAKSHGFGAMIRSTESGKPIVHLTRLTPEISAVSERAPEPMPVPTPTVEQAKPDSVWLPLGITNPSAHGDLWIRIIEHAKNAYNAFWNGRTDNEDYETWETVLHHRGFDSLRMQRISVGAYIASVGGAK